jgi:Membrane bound beta barrel domain (DUF5777)
MPNNKIAAAVFTLLFITPALVKAQDEDLLKMVGQEDTIKREPVKNAFKSSRVIMGHSMEMIGEGVLDFRILHRFGPLNRGAYDFFGLDQATIRLSLDYGITPRLTVGLGRSTNKKELDAFAKYQVIQQSTGTKAMPFSLVAIAGITMNGLKWSDTTRKNYFSSRLAYYGQVIIGRKFSDRFTLQLTPTVVHQNLVQRAADPSDVFALGVGSRVKLTRRLSLNLDYFYNFNGITKDVNYHPFSVGFDIETGGHVFQLHFSNAVGMNERSFITETTNSWGKGDIQFGFNISRSFQVKKRR